jgi:hypothetical protein
VQSPSHLFITASDGESVVGALSDSEIAVDVDFPSGDQELDRFVAEHPGARFLFGCFPARGVLPTLDQLAGLLETLAPEASNG